MCEFLWATLYDLTWLTDSQKANGDLNCAPDERYDDSVCGISGNWRQSEAGHEQGHDRYWTDGDVFGRTEERVHETAHERRIQTVLHTIAFALLIANGKPNRVNKNRGDDKQPGSVKRADTVVRVGLGRLAAWHLLGGPVGPASRWAATLNDKVSQTTYPVNRDRQGERMESGIKSQRWGQGRMVWYGGGGPGALSLGERAVLGYFCSPSLSPSSRLRHWWSGPSAWEKGLFLDISAAPPFLRVHDYDIDDRAGLST